MDEKELAEIEAEYWGWVHEWHTASPASHIPRLIAALRASHARVEALEGIITEWRTKREQWEAVGYYHHGDLEDFDAAYMRRIGALADLEAGKEAQQEVSHDKN